MPGFSLLWIKKNELKKFELWWIMRKQKKSSDKNQCFDWMQSIQSYQLINNDWLADIDLFDSMILFV